MRLGGKISHFSLSLQGEDLAQSEFRRLSPGNLSDSVVRRIPFDRLERCRPRCAALRNRSNNMVPRLGLASLALAVLTYVGAAQVGSPPLADDSAKVKEEVSLKEKQIAAKFQEFEQLVLRLKQRLALSSSQADRDQAAVLDRVLEYCKERSISVKFEQILEDLKTKKLDSTTDIRSTLDRVKTVADDLKDVVAMLREDLQGKSKRDQIERYKELIKALEVVIRDQKSVQGLTQNGRTQKEELKDNQNGVTKKTETILAKLEGKDGQKNGKGDEKAPGKNGDKSAQAKDDGDKSGDKAGDKSGDKSGKESSPAEAKAGGDSKDPKGDAKPGDGSENAKDGKDGGKEGSPAQAKGGDDKKSGDSKSGDSKSGKSPEGAQAKESGKGGDPKAGDPKSGDPKSGKLGDPAQAKAGGPKAGEPKSGAGEAKAGKPSEGAQAKAGSPGEAKPGEAKSGEGKPGEGKPGEGKPGAGKAQAKAGPSSKGQGEAKGDGSASPMPPSGSPQPSAKSPPPGPSPSGAPKDTQIAKKQIQEGNQSQQEAEKNIDKGKNDEASGDQNTAIKKLEDAKKELERLLRQLREEETERILAQLQARCEKMLAMQQVVLAGTERVDKAITDNADKTATRENKQDSLKLSDSEGDIVVEATRAIEILEAEGSAIAFPEVFQQVREDMKHVQRRLGVTDTAKVTQVIETEIIDTLKEMIEALKKKRQENQSQPKPSDGPPPPPQDQKLLDKIAELKMIRSMQVRINGRTQTYGKMYTGEQTAEPVIRRELHGLSDRQERLFEITNRMARGDNK
jgi:hypothetical protein